MQVLPEGCDRMRRMLVLILAIPLSGCVIKPDAASREPERLDAVGRDSGYATSRVNGPRPNTTELPASPTWQDVLERAFRANGDLEAAFHGAH